MNRRNSIILLFVFSVFIFSCGGSETKTPQQSVGIDTLHYEDTVAVVKQDSVSLADSILSVMQKVPVFIDDTAALALKTRLAADTTSAKISDSAKKEIRKAIDYMNRKQNR